MILSLNLQDEDPENAIDRDQINAIYRKAANGYLSRYLSYSDSQNVSSDIVGTVSAAVIEGRETHTRTGGVKVSLGKACRLVTRGQPIEDPASGILEVPVTQVVVYGWYDNELGSFSNILGETTIEVAKSVNSNR